MGPHVAKIGKLSEPRSRIFYHLGKCQLKKVLLTILACIVVAGAGAVGFIYSGIYDVAAIHPDHPLIAWALHETSERAVAARLRGIDVPSGLDKPDVIKAGGKLFGENCVVCHGGPGLKPTNIAQGLTPPPPNLYRATRKPRMDEMFWFIQNGVKMTAMPGFAKNLSDEQMWSVAAYLRTAPGMTPQVFSEDTGIPTAAANAPAAAH